MTKPESFRLPVYIPPDFTSPAAASAPDARWETVFTAGVAPDGFHSTSMFPEYVKIGGVWHLLPESRMDSSVVKNPNGSLSVTENRNLRVGDSVLLGRSDDGRDGIYVHPHGFPEEENRPYDPSDCFTFRQGRSRETSYTRDYDRLASLLNYERENGGKIVWVMGPACSFDSAARSAAGRLIDAGYVHALLAGNALATHDLEGALLHTALGQDIYSGESKPGGHYHHLDVLNKVRRCGSIARFIEEEQLDDGIMCRLVRNHIPFVLTGSIRDDGPLPEVYADVYEGAAAMRDIIRGATTVICLATMLHTIAVGNMTPSYRVLPDGAVRPVFLCAVDQDEFVVNKLRDRGSLSAVTMVTNVQDFLTRLADRLG